jgi:hypothetical protein
MILLSAVPVIIFLILFHSCSALISSVLSPHCTTAYGPGLDPRISVLKRHFTIQLCTAAGVNLTSSPLVDFPEFSWKDSVVSAFLEGFTWRGEPIHSGIRVANRGDGEGFLFFFFFLILSLPLAATASYSRYLLRRLLDLCPTDQFEDFGGLKWLSHQGKPLCSSSCKLRVLWLPCPPGRIQGRLSVPASRQPAQEVAGSISGRNKKRCHRRCRPDTPRPKCFPNRPLCGEGQSHLCKRFKARQRLQISL